MLYLLDANVLIDAHRDYYPIDRVPEFWEWLEHHGANGTVKIPLEIHEEVKDGNDELAEWVKRREAVDALLLQMTPDRNLVDRAVRTGYAQDITDDELEKLGRDPFLLAYALTNPAEIRIVTTEVSKPSKTRANKHIPNAASALGVQTRNTFQFLRELDFRTSWQ